MYYKDRDSSSDSWTDSFTFYKDNFSNQYGKTFFQVKSKIK